MSSGLYSDERMIEVPAGFAGAVWSEGWRRARARAAVVV